MLQPRSGRIGRWSRTFPILTLIPLLWLLTEPLDAQVGSVSGRVLADDSERPLPGADLTLSPGGLSVRADSDGRFSFSRVPAGDHLLLTSAPGSRPGSTRIRVSAGEAVELTLRLEDAPLRLSGITASVSRGGARPLEETTSTLSILGRREIEDLPALTTDELLRGIPGVQLPLLNTTVNFPANPSISMRGLGIGDNATRTLVLLDGMPMNGPFFGNVYWTRVPVQGLRRAEVMRGGGSSSFGSYAMGGVLSLFTELPEAAPDLEVETRGGTHNTFQVAAAGGGPVGESVRVRASANYFRTDGHISIAPEERSPIDAPSGAEAFSFRTRAEFLLGDAWTANLRFEFLTDERDQTTVLSGTSNDLWSVGAEVSRMVADRGHFSARFQFLDEEWHTTNASLVTRGDRSAEFVSNVHDTPSEDWSGSLVYTQGLGEGATRFSAGADFRRVDGKNEANIFASDGSFALARTGRGRQSSVGLFGELEWEPRSDLLISLAARGDFFSIADGSVLESGPAAGDSESFEDRTFEEFSPSVGFRWEATDALALRGSAFRSFRSPTLAELYRSFGTTTFVGLANAELEPETLDGVEGGFDLRLGRASFSAVGFWNDLSDAVGSVVVGFSPFTLLNENIGEIRSRGVEVSGDVLLARDLSLNLSYTYTDSEVTGNEDDPEVVGNRMEGAPQHQWTGALSYAPRQGLGFSLRGRYLAEQFQDISNEARLGPHAVFDASATYRLPAGYEVFVQAQNLLDRTYVASAFGGVSRLGAPRQVFVGARARIR